MALQKQAVNINFMQGLDTKTDPYQVQMGKFLSLTNSVFTTTGRLTKRNGFAQITELPHPLVDNATQYSSFTNFPAPVNTNTLAQIEGSGFLYKASGSQWEIQPSQTNLMTLNDNLLATGSNLYAYSTNTNQWLNQGLIQPVNLSTQSMVRNSSSQTSPDAGITSSGLTCLAYADNGALYYHIIDNNTGQQIVPRTLIANATNAPRVFVLAHYFIITFISTITGTYHLQYLAIPIAVPDQPGTIMDISTSLNNTSAGYDGYSLNGNLYIAWSDAADIMLSYLTPGLILATPAVLAGQQANLLSMSVDITQSLPIIYLAYWDSGSSNGYAAAYNILLAQVLAPTQIITSQTLASITSTATRQLCSIFYEVNNDYSAPYPATVRTDYIETVTITQSGTVSSNTVILRSVGLASKAFINISGTIFMMAAYGEADQPTYFLIDSTGAVYMRLAYSNGGGYVTDQTLPNVSLIGNEYLVPYLFKDFLTTVNKGTNLPSGTPVNAIYTQTGINLARFTINDSKQYTSEIASTLHLTGGQLWMYDAVKPVEHNFHVWPEDIQAQTSSTGGSIADSTYNYSFTYEWTDNEGNLHRSAPSIPTVVTTTGTPVDFTSIFSANASTLTVSSTTGLAVGQVISDTTTGSNIQANTYITSIVGSTIGLSLPTVGPSQTAEYVFVIPSSSITAGTIYTNNGYTYTVSSTTSSSTILPVVGSGPPQSSGTLTFVSGSPSGNLAFSSVDNVYTFTIPSSSITAGTIYTNNGHTFTVTATTSSSTSLVAYGTGAPTASGTLTFVSGSPSGNIAFSAETVSTPGDALTTSSTSSNTLYVPTLRLTYKVPPNPVRIVGYRWSVAQQVFYQFTSVTNPVLNDTTIDYVTIVDTKSDAQILGNAILYTTGGVVENIAAPASIASCLYSNRLFLVDAEDRNLLWYSKQVIEAVPVEMSDLFTLYIAPTSGAQGSTGPVTALSAMDDKLIIFKRDAIYYITGAGPDNTGANNDFSDPVFITSSVGCSNPSSIVLVPNGIMFQSDKGIWLLGRDLSTNYIGAPVEAFNSSLVVSALNIPGTTQARFILDSNIMLMYDYFFDQWGTFTNKNAISACLYQNTHTYLNEFGFVFQESPGYYLDGTDPVLMNFTTSWINIAGLQGFQRLYFMLFLGTYYTPFTLNASIAYNYNPGSLQLINVKPENFTPNWGGGGIDMPNPGNQFWGSDPTWGSDAAWGAANTPQGNNPPWGSENNWGGGQGTGSSADSAANVFQARLFPEQQKCESFQLSVYELYDSTFGVSPGAGLTFSGLNLVIGAKKGFRTQRASQSFG